MRKSVPAQTTPFARRLDEFMAEKGMEKEAEKAAKVGKDGKALATVGQLVSLPEVLDLTIFGKTISVVRIKFGLMLGWT